MMRFVTKSLREFDTLRNKEAHQMSHRTEFFCSVDRLFHIFQRLLVVLRVTLREIESRHWTQKRISSNSSIIFDHSLYYWAA